MKPRLLSFKLLSFKLLSFNLLFWGFACLLTSNCWADVNGNSGNDGGAIPDNVPAGHISTVTITASEIIQDAKFNIEGLTHSWIGDLIITIAHSTSGKSATLMHRVGTTSNPASLGDSSDVNGTYMFQDGSNASIWSEAANGDTDYIVAPGAYDASGDNEAVVSLNTIFGGELTNGDWTFTVSDNNATQSGTFVQTSVEFVSVAVPEPGTMATIVLGTLFGGVLLRRRHQKKLKAEKANG